MLSSKRNVASVAQALAATRISSITSAFNLSTGEPRSRRVAADIVGLFDVLAVVIGGLIPSHFYALQGPGLISSGVPALQWALIVAVMVYGGLRHFNLYDTSAMNDFPVAPGKLFLCLALALFAVHGIGLPFTVADSHMWIWYVSWLSVSFTLALGNRIVANRILARMTAAGAFDTRVAVYGTGEIAARLDKHLRDPALGIQFAGVFDDRTANRSKAKSGKTEPSGDALSNAGGMDELIAAGRAGQIDQIVISLPQTAGHRSTEIIKRLEQLPVSIHVCTHIASDLVTESTQLSLSKLGPIGLLDVRPKPLSDWEPLLKSAEDYLLGAILLIAAAPVMALAALAIKLSGKGPVLFKQRRRGLNRQVIEIYKFRTMHVMQDENDVEQAVKDDPRITPVGRFLRRTSIDELPQLVNVLKGEMSLVGPRPHALVHDEHYGRLLQTYANRHQVKPGMTGWAQVNGFRGETKTPEMMSQRVAFDLDYIRSWSLWFDLRILARTIHIIATNKNAY